VAQYLVAEHGFTRFRFAEPLKDMLVTLGLTREQVDGSLTAKMTPSDLLCGKTPRHAMQTLGTEWRDMIDKRLWANITKHRVAEFIEAAKHTGKDKIVIDDMRFPHEAELMRDLGITIVAIRRPEVEPSRTGVTLSTLRVPSFVRSLMHLLFGIKTIHRSETEWFKIEPDFTVPNRGTVADLYDRIDDCLML
jgi:hypothetical protein